MLTVTGIFLAFTKSHGASLHQGLVGHNEVGAAASPLDRMRSIERQRLVLLIRGGGASLKGAGNKLLCIEGMQGCNGCRTESSACQIEITLIGHSFVSPFSLQSFKNVYVLPRCGPR